MFDLVSGLVQNVKQIKGLDRKCIWVKKNIVLFRDVASTSQTRNFISVSCLRMLANSLRLIFERHRPCLRPSITKRFHECSSIFIRACECLWLSQQICEYYDIQGSCEYPIITKRLPICLSISKGARVCLLLSN